MNTYWNCAPVISIDDDLPHMVSRLHEPKGFFDICYAIRGDRRDGCEVSSSKEIHDLPQRLARDRAPVCSEEVKPHCNEAGAPLKWSHPEIGILNRVLFPKLYEAAEHCNAFPSLSQGVAC